MKILLTGMTPKQCGPQKTWVHYTFFDQLNMSLGLLGHEVDWRPVYGGDDLSNYDFAVIGLHCPASISAKRYKFGAYWAAYLLPHLPLLQDWRVRDVCAQLRGNETSVWNYFARTDKEDEIYNLASAVHEQIDKVRRAWQRGPETILAPMFKWADPELLKKWHRFGTVLPWDPDGVFEPIRGPEAMNRYRRWVCASLTNQDDWIDDLECEWPVEYVYRTKESRDVGGVTPKGMQFLPLSELGLIRSWYAESWGILIPDYGKECPPSWWRSRFKIGAQNGSVVFGTAGPPEEAYQLPIGEIEQKKIGDLHRLADAQAEAYFKHASTQEDSLNQLAYALARGTAPIGG